MNDQKSDKKYEYLWKLSPGWYGTRVFSKDELTNLPDKFKIKVRYSKFYEPNKSKSAMFVLTFARAGANDTETDDKLNVVLENKATSEADNNVFETVERIKQIALRALNNPQIEPSSKVSYGEAVQKGIDKSAGRACYDIVNLCEKFLKG